MRQLHLGWRAVYSKQAPVGDSTAPGWERFLLRPSQAQEGNDKRDRPPCHNQALLVEGMPIEDPVAFALAISELMV